MNARITRARPGAADRTRDPGRAVDASRVLPILGVVLLMPPVITLFARAVDVAGVPLVVVYLFGVWLALIACAGLLAQRLRHATAEDDETRRAVD